MLTKPHLNTPILHSKNNIHLAEMKKKDGCTKYWGNLNEDLFAMIKLWGPSDCIQFVLPIHMSMPFRHMVSFFWTAYVSFTRGGGGGKDEKDDAEELGKLRRRLSVSGDSA